MSFQRYEAKFLERTRPIVEMCAKRERDWQKKLQDAVYKFIRLKFDSEPTRAILKMLLTAPPDVMRDFLNSYSNFEKTIEMCKHRLEKEERSKREREAERQKT